ncbi:MAG: dTDP-4-dehydrorhamnose 3,5-epimerase [Bacteroidales bacterium]|nr:dTDP-4-dehydrorhamnose 3,5-epimerase [Bacteroidales bacterium]MCF8351250.1 dTDP-4-dehydrorhamnose 3,5-epimerase [Bacteroidales bacterium]MCF8377599.1 dTDP-4-dehydrorhamnose 3,5-epimerase [Bacteroidales bacterium]MCF8401888.1 dTDP-4-dehydrorhamnose 3,5-epimerase [Bacteroidales bacterium]
MKIIKTNIPVVLLIEPKVFADDRGYFFESYNRKEFVEHGIPEIFIQDNESKSQKGVLRGLHFQKPPYAQGKLVRVIKGAVIDVAVDIRKGSESYGQWTSAELSEENKKMLWVPPGMAHGFVTLEDETIFSYKCTELYNKNSEGSIRWDDPDLNINWGVENPVLSEKDKQAPLFRDFVSPF